MTKTFRKEEKMQQDERGECVLVRWVWDKKRTEKVVNGIWGNEIKEKNMQQSRMQR